MTPFRCNAASLARDEPAYGTASTVRGYLLVEYAGAWGRDALRDSRLPEAVKTHLREVAAQLGIKVLLIRRHARQRADAGDAGCRVFAAYADAHAPRAETTTLAQHEDLLDLDVTPLGRGASLGLTAHHEPLFLTCTHGRHDTCCAELGRPVAKTLAAHQPGHAWEVSHIGGDRFAGNVLVLPEGLYYGRVEPSNAAGLASRHLDGRLSLDLLRGRSGYPIAVQAAEWFLRTELGEDRLRALRLQRRERLGEDWQVTFDVSGQVWAVRLRVGARPPEQLTCTALRLNPAPTYELLDIAGPSDS
ncbi:MAG: sucrase ferredoxin [Nocardioidaceae bacterium]|nr:sucrase ferredoxin [Nocardioidaceae bacterium]